jgi:FtsP/CotA-like multicopper oxidase with cupredoxin domain
VDERARFRLPALIWASLLLGSPTAAQEPSAAAVAECPGAVREHASLAVPAPDLTCIALLPTDAAPDARGAAMLRPPAGPFTVGVTREGVIQHRFVLDVVGLPAPSELGPYTRYVAWITPPGLSPMIALGEVRNGRSELAAAGFNQYLLLISAEGPVQREERIGPLVLRGTSPAMVLRPHDLPTILAEMSAPATPQQGAGGGAAHDAHGLEINLPPGSQDWRPPPMHPAVQMPTQMMSLRPDVEAFLPVGGSGATGESPTPEARVPEAVRLAAGDTLLLEAGPVLRRIAGAWTPGYGFNGQSPGPRIEVQQGVTVYVRVRNRTPLPTGIHWHGIRLDATSDGVPGVTQPLVQSGGEFLYELRFPDEGTFWYHPHVREDVMQDLGLAGNLRVLPSDRSLYGPVDREEVLILDDQLVGPAGPVPYGREAPVHALMGRFGNVALVNGQSDWTMIARPGEVVRYHITNAASTRTFNLSFGELPLKLVGSDVGKLPSEKWVESLVVAPAERWIVEVRFPDAGLVPFESRVQALDPLGARFFPEVFRLGAVRVEAGQPATTAAPRPDFDALREAPTVRAALDDLASLAAGAPLRTLVLGLRTTRLPFPLDPLLLLETYRAPVEWSGTMLEMDWLATGRSVQWVLRDGVTGAENMDIGWRFRLGETMRLRIVNDRSARHAMQHSIHLHGQRFLVLSVDGEPNTQPAWKDTVLVPTGGVVELLVRLDNAGPWMLHCHIAEHLETGMMTLVQVEP